MIPEESHYLAQRLAFALAYPFPRPLHDFLMIDGRSYAIEAIPSGAARSDVARWTVRRGVERLEAAPLLAEAGVVETRFESLEPVIAVGSNASPLQLARKFHHLPGELAVCLTARVRDVVSVYAGHIAPYGSIPATLAEAEEATSQLIVNFLSAPLMAQMHATENLGEHYALTEVHALTYERRDAPAVRPSLAYASEAPALPFRIAGLESEGSALPALSQWEIQDHVIQRLGLDLPVEAFVLENIEHASLRRERERALSTQLRAELDLPGDG